MENVPSLGFAPGTLAIWAALIGGAATMLAYFRALRLAPAHAGGGSFDASRDAPFDRAVAFARRLYVFYVGAIVLASLLLMRLLLAHDFRVSYVASYSGRDL